MKEARKEVIEFREASAYACGHCLEFVLSEDCKTAYLTIDGCLADTETICMALGISPEMCDKFMRTYGECTGNPIQCKMESEKVRRAQIQMFCMAGYATSLKKNRDIQAC